MAKIVYAVQGEGLGHAIRSKVVIQHLLKKKHDVVIVSSGRAYEVLKKNFRRVYDIHYFHIVYENNEVSRFKTAVQNIRKTPKALPGSMTKLFKLLYKWEPAVVITDFEPFSRFLSKLFMIPLIAIDNVNVLARSDIEVDKKHLVDYAIAKIISRSFIRGANKYILTTFFYPEVKEPEKTVLVPPSLRPEILRAKPKTGKHILVYQTSSSNTDMLDILKKTDHQYIIYGFNKDERDKNLKFKKFSERGFIKDLSTSKGVIVNGGFTVLSEAIYLGKPVMSIPVKHQFEQILNAKYIEKNGYGMYAPEINSEKLEEFLSLLPKYRYNLKFYKQEGNKILFREVDKAVDGVLEEKPLKRKIRDFRKKVNHNLKKVVKKRILLSL